MLARTDLVNTRSTAQAAASDTVQFRRHN